MTENPVPVSAAATAEDHAAAAQRFLTTQELMAEARRKLTSELWDFISGGTESETTLRRNRLGLDSLALRPRVLRNVEKVDASTTLLGQKLRIPVVLAPLGGLTIFDPIGAAAIARAAASRSSLVFQSSASQPGLETTAPLADGRMVFQLYVRGDAAWLEAYAERIKQAGCRALCFTVDSSAYSKRERDMISRFTASGGSYGVMSPVGREHQARFNWNDLDRIRAKTDLPIIIKGIATGEDAEIAVERGITMLYVSNHGGRQLDHGLSGIEMLPEIVQAVRGKAEVLVDGGFVRGTDVLKAIALGAKAVGIGKLTAWSFVAAGEAGVARMLDILEEEIVKDLMMMGITSLGQLNNSSLQAARPTNEPSVISAFTEPTPPRKV